MKYLPLLLLLSCASHMRVSFLDSTEKMPEQKSAHVCILQSPNELECIALEHFMQMLNEERRQPARFQGDL